MGAMINPLNRQIFHFTFKEAILLLALCLCMGCGYHFSANGKSMGIRIESIAIPMIESTSSNTGFESDFTRIIREEFISHAKVPLLPSEKAQSVLTGLISDIRTEALTYNLRQRNFEGDLITDEVTSSRRLKIKLNMKLTDRITGKIIWHEEDMEEKAGFRVEEDPLATRYNQRQALQKIARQLAKKIYLKTMERF